MIASLSSKGSRQKYARNNECPCGKSYPNSPALITHIKVKHDGKVTSFYILDY